MARRTKSSALTKPPKTGDDSEQGEALRLETRPSPVLPSVLAGSLSILILALIGFAATVKVNQVVNLPGKLVTRRSTQDLTTPEEGVVKEVLVRSGEVVKQGQPLVILDPRVQRSNVNELNIQLQAESSRLASAEARLRERISGLERQELIDERLLTPLKDLAREGASSQMQMIMQERQLEATRRELAEARQEQQTLAFESQRSQAQLRASLVQSQSALDLVTLRAPANGTVIDLEAQTGQVVKNDVSLLKLVPTDELLAQTFAKDSDIGFIRAGQTAEIALTSYDKSVYGTLPATVTLVSQDALAPEPPYDYPHFPVTLDLSAQELNANNKSFELQPGMALTAQIQLQKLTPLQLFFSRLTRSTDAVRSMR
jgi:multidrug resistance efflux pump